MDDETFDKARRYQLDKSNFEFWLHWYSQIESTVSLSSQELKSVIEPEKVVYMTCCLFPAYIIVRWSSFAMVFIRDHNF